MEIRRAREVRATPADPTSFTDRVIREEVFKSHLPEGMAVHRFTYPPGHHSHWHVHLGEQGLYVLAGQGWVKFEGEEKTAVGPGDLIYVAPGVRHWHGATAENLFVHLAFTASKDTEWKGEVTEEQYLNGSD